MAHAIFGNRFATWRAPAWHKIGHVFNEPMRAIDAIRLACMDYRIEKYPLKVDVQTPFGSYLQDTNKFALVRAPTEDDPRYRIFGVVSRDYVVLQNEDIARVVDKLTERWPVETVGALQYGSLIFITLYAGTVHLANLPSEEIRQYFLISENRDGGTALKIAFTPVRVVCQNTLVTGLRRATVTATLVHTPGIENAFTTRINLIQRLQQAQVESLEIFDRMAKVILTSDDIETVFERVYPYPPMPEKAKILTETIVNDIAELYDEATKAQAAWEYYCQRAITYRNSAKELLECMNDEHPSIANTAWAVYNAVVESADYRDGTDSVPVSALFGARANEKRRAFNAVLAYL